MSSVISVIFVYRKYWTFKFKHNIFILYVKLFSQSNSYNILFSHVTGVFFSIKGGICLLKSYFIENKDKHYK